jgi:hypothetical protein
MGRGTEGGKFTLTVSRICGMAAGQEAAIRLKEASFTEWTRDIGKVM